jgi:hypothetical protein
MFFFPFFFFFFWYWIPNWVRCILLVKAIFFCRCPSYSNMTSSCVLVTDSNDPCCKVPKCGFDVAAGHIVSPVPSYSQISTGIGIVKPPTPTSYPYLNHNSSWVIFNTTGLQPAPPTAPANVKQGKGIRSECKNYRPTVTWVLETNCNMGFIFVMRVINV